VRAARAEVLPSKRAGAAHTSPLPGDRRTSNSHRAPRKSPTHHTTFAMGHAAGLRAGTRYAFSRDFKKKGMVSLLDARRGAIDTNPYRSRSRPTSTSTRSVTSSTSLPMVRRPSKNINYRIQRGLQPDRCRAEGYAVQGLPRQDWYRLQRDPERRRRYPVRSNPRSNCHGRTDSQTARSRSVTDTWRSASTSVSSTSSTPDPGRTSSSA
jgi:hypothetical protein